MQSATGDLWSAYKADPAASLTPSGGETAPADAGPGTAFGVGLALFGLGAALLGGAALAVGRRRRSPAASTDRR